MVRRVLLLIGSLWLLPTAHAACPALLQQPFQPLLGGEAQSMCRFAGQVVLVVNTASRCAFTPQYEGLEALYRRYKARGFVIVGFPSNDFGAQEPGTNHKIADFCETTYGVDFPLQAKTPVTGPDAHPLYQALQARTGVAPGWNFHKYLIDATGGQVVSFPSEVRPRSRQLTDLIERWLAARDATQ
ncbi:glutathione peroxidase [Nitrogeniibacter mangrovi]|uniref:Glutathione peroxidase n=1 Tax=Nitrogeniibacter mangrovi TaxID=2016596 RepID=A0A6C1B4F1_9RHOO|nr:glutathione peroxidase [Nitrogeniibacter mangrovi]QID17074.1 glutathione peroxidase [Nitrogeniibacter mangrovi]